MARVCSLVTCARTDGEASAGCVERQAAYLAALGDRLQHVAEDRGGVTLGFAIQAQQALAVVLETPFTLAGLWYDPSAWAPAPLMDNRSEYPEAEIPAIRAVPMPLDENLGGNVFGGWLLNQIDHAAGIAAWRHARSRCASVSMHMTFDDRISIGDEVSLFARVVSTGRTSMRLAIDAWARPRMDDARRLVGRAETIFVALDEAGRPRVIG